MGTLDDAIRQHLELKRRSGASETEVERLESEALGPARPAAEPIAAPVDPPAATELPPPPGAAAQPLADEQATRVEPVVRREPVVRAEPSAPHLEPPVPRAEPLTPRAEPPAERVETPVPRAEPPAPVDPTPAGESWLDDDDFAPEVPPAAAQRTSEFTAHEASDAQGGAPQSDYVAPDDEGEDLLEETPEFLQETPEHDRLWFEQKPPRDFDFDQ